jgi:hypothetical protein
MLREIFDMIALRIMGYIVPREHLLLPPPRDTRRAARFFTDNPNYVRLFGLTQSCPGIWPPLWHHREG